MHHKRKREKLGETIRVYVRVAGGTVPSKVLKVSITACWNDFVGQVGEKLGVAIESFESFQIRLGEDALSPIVESVGELEHGDTIFLAPATSSLDNERCKPSSSGSNRIKVENDVTIKTEKQSKETDKVTYVNVSSESDGEDDNDDDGVVSDDKSDSSDDEESQVLSSSESSDEDIDDDSDYSEPQPNKMRRKSVSGRAGGEGGGSGAASKPTKQITAKPKKSTRGSSKAEAERKKEERRPTFRVHIRPEDIPDAPGGGIDGGNIGDNTTNEDPKLTALKLRVAKILDRGMHPSTPEAEAQQALKLAQRLLTKFNLTQASVMEAREDGLQDRGAMKGGLVTVDVQRVIYAAATGRKGRPRKQSTAAGGGGGKGESGGDGGGGGGGDVASGEGGGVLRYEVANPPRWVRDIAPVAGENFGVKVYTVIHKKNSRFKRASCRFVFYGIRTNAQLAAYSFKTVVGRIAILKAGYDPKAAGAGAGAGTGEFGTSSGYSRNAKGNYCDGLVSGLRNAMRADKKWREEKQKQRLEAARLRVEKGGEDGKEAYETSSDDEDEGGGGDDGCSWGGGVKEVKVEDVKVKGEDDASESEAGPSTSFSSPASPSSSSSSTTPSSSWSLEQRRERAVKTLMKLEERDRVAGALVVHSEDVAEKVLKSKGVKLRKAKKRAPVAFNWTAYKKGKEDAKTIDLNQRAITDNKQGAIGGTS